MSPSSRHGSLLGGRAGQPAQQEAGVCNLPVAHPVAFGLCEAPHTSIPPPPRDPHEKIDAVLEQHALVPRDQTENPVFYLVVHP